MIWVAAAFHEYGETWQLNRYPYSKNNMTTYLPSMLSQFIILDISFGIFVLCFECVNNVGQNMQLTASIIGIIFISVRKSKIFVFFLKDIVMSVGKY